MLAQKVFSFIYILSNRNNQMVRDRIYYTCSCISVYICTLVPIYSDLSILIYLFWYCYLLYNDIVWSCKPNQSTYNVNDIVWSCKPNQSTYNLHLAYEGQAWVFQEVFFIFS